MKQEIINKIDSLRKEFPFLMKEKDYYIFNAVAVQTIFYKNPSHPLEASHLEKIIVDGKMDGGIDCILTDEDSDFSDIILMQCKYNESFTLEEIKATLDKLYAAYLHLIEGKYSYFKDNLVSQYTECNYEMEDNAKVHFVLCISSPQKNIKMKSITNYFNTIIGDNTNLILDVYFEKDIVDKIVEFDSLRRTVSNGIIKMDYAQNYLSYKEIENELEADAIIINSSAWSIKELYSRHHLALFSQNLRFFVKSKNIDIEIKKSIDKYKKKFWYKNNGITIICDSFEITGKEVRLTNFSIINGGQTTTLLGLHDSLNEKNDFFLPLKIIKIQGLTEEERQHFIFEIAIATNSQKAIKPADLKANRPEQILFANEMRKINIFYRTKRGEAIPKNYSSKEKNLDLSKASKLGLAGIYLLPGTSRSKPSIIYSEETSFYDEIFLKYRENSTVTIKDLLYIDNYFDTKFKKEYQRKTKQTKKVTFANNSRTLCLAYCGFLSKYLNNEFNDNQLYEICNFDYKDSKEVKNVQKTLSNPTKLKGIFNQHVYENLDVFEDNLYKIFAFICKQGFSVFETVNVEETTDESNWLKKDVSFYRIIANSFDDLREMIEENGSVFQMFKK